MNKQSELFEPFEGNMDLSSVDLGAFVHGFDERLQAIEERLQELGSLVETMRRYLADWVRDDG